MVSIDKEQIKYNFGQGSATYDQYAIVQKQMAEKLLNQIVAEGKEFKNILEIGCGTGFLTEGLAKAFPQSQVLTVDISPEMVEKARKKLSNCHNITYLIGDAEELEVDNSYDLIVSSAVFHWFHNYLKPFTRFYNFLEEEGLFIFNTFGENTFCELSQALIFLGKNLPRKNFINSGELGLVLSACGFKNYWVKDEIYKEYYQSARKLLVGIKKIGANSHATVASSARFHGGEIFKLTKFFDSNFSDKNGVYITYHILCGYAQKDSTKGSVSG